MRIGETTPGLADGLERGPVSVLRGDAQEPVVFVCEHASNFIPPEFNNLGLDDVAASSHIAWDPGARLVTQFLRQAFDGTSVMSNVSRLVYDCNRPPDSSDAMPARSEIYDIPGNSTLTRQQEDDRVEKYYRPFERALENEIKSHEFVTALVTIHSFTPIYNGNHREVELGVLHDDDSRFADAILTLSDEHTRLRTMRNQPYGPEHGVTHTLKRHGLENGLLNVMIEVRNDLLPTQDACRGVADELYDLLTNALDRCADRESAEGIESAAEVNR